VINSQNSNSKDKIAARDSLALLLNENYASAGLNKLMIIATIITSFHKNMYLFDEDEHSQTIRLSLTDNNISVDPTLNEFYNRFIKNEFIHFLKS
jgi:hypothetical protein